MAARKNRAQTSTATTATPTETAATETAAAKRTRRTTVAMLADARRNGGHFGEAAYVRSRLGMLITSGSDLLGQMSPEARKLLLDNDTRLGFFTE